jgi:hypothetical protein
VPPLGGGVTNAGARSGRRPIRHARSGGHRNHRRPSGRRARNPGSGRRTGGAGRSGRRWSRSWVVSCELREVYRVRGGVRGSGCATPSTGQYPFRKSASASRYSASV